MFTSGARKWLKHERLDKGFTQKEVADMAGISLGYYRKIENGSRGVDIAVRRIEAIGSVLGFDIVRWAEEERKWKHGGH